MRKKLISLLLCLAMTVSVCACGDTTAGKTETESKVVSSETMKESAATPSTEQEEDKPLYPLVGEPITVKGLVMIERDLSNGRIVWDKVSEITNVNFEWIVVNKETLPVILAGGNWEFDFILSSIDNTLVNDYGQEGGMFADYNDYLEYMPHLQQTFEDYPEALKAIRETNGAIYRLPNIEESATMTQVRPYYRKDMLKEVGYEELNTVDDFYNALKALKEKLGTPAWCPPNIYETTYLGAWLYSAFGPAVTADFDDDGTGKVVYNRISDQYKYYLQFLNKLYEEELIDQEYLTIDNNYAKSLAMEGKTAFFAGEAHSLKEEHLNGDITNLGVLAPLTSEYDSERKVLAQLPVTVGGCFLNAESDYLVELCQVFDIMYSTEEVVEGTGLCGQSFTYGFEGVHWICNDDNTYELVTPEGFSGSFTDFQYNELIVANVGRATALKGYITSTPGNGQERQKGFAENVFPYACDNSEVFPASFLKFTPDEQTVITNKFTDIHKYTDEMKAKFITGVKDIDTEWEEYCSTVEQMGLADVLDMYQAAYDRWNQ